MSFRWISEPNPRWDADKARIVGGAPAGVFDRRYRETREGDSIPGAWWCVKDGDAVVGYGWLDVVWGEAEVLLATAADATGAGVGSFVLEQLETEAKRRGVNYIYNTVRPTHPERDRVSAWLKKRGFEGSDDGSLIRPLVDV